MAAALVLARGQEPPPELLWDPEDGTEFRWHLAQDRERLHIRVTRVPGSIASHSEKTFERPRTVLDGDCQVHTFCAVVERQAREVLASYGPKRYAELTMGAFPFELLEDLQAAVALLSR